MKDYFIKQIEDIKSNPKSIIKKWYFWLIVIAIIYGLITDVFAPKEVATSYNNIEKNTIIEEKIETEEERIKREEKEKKEAEEKAEKERQKNIEDTKWTLYATDRKSVV